jgi:hypothetical protein
LRAWPIIADSSLTEAGYNFKLYDSFTIRLFICFIEDGVLGSTPESTIRKTPNYFRHTEKQTNMWKFTANVFNNIFNDACGFVIKRRALTKPKRTHIFSIYTTKIK